MEQRKFIKTTIIEFLNESNIKVDKIMETYIMTFEDGMHYVATKITAEDENAVCDGILSIIRCSDAKELLPTGEWQDLPKWGAE